MNELERLERRERDRPESMIYEDRQRLAQLRRYRDRDEDDDVLAIGQCWRPPAPPVKRKRTKGPTTASVAGVAGKGAGGAEAGDAGTRETK